MADKITLCFKHIKKEIYVPDDYEELLESFHEKFKANKNNIFYFNYEDKFVQKHTLKENEICPSIFNDIQQLSVEEEEPIPNNFKKKINQIEESYKEEIKNLKETYEQKINDKENQIVNLNQHIKKLKNQIDELLLKLKEIPGYKEKIEEFRKDFCLDDEHFKDEQLLELLIENNFDYAKTFYKLLT